MHIKSNGYVSGAIVLRKFMREFRDHVEYEKFLARVLVDNETTQEFKIKTDKLEDKLYKFRYNNSNSMKLTKAGKSERQ